MALVGEAPAGVVPVLGEGRSAQEAPAGVVPVLGEGRWAEVGLATVAAVAEATWRRILVM